MQHDTTDKAEGIALFDIIADALVAVVIARLSARLDGMSRDIAELVALMSDRPTEALTKSLIERALASRDMADRVDDGAKVHARLDRALKEVAEVAERVTTMQDEVERLERDLEDRPDEDRVEDIARDALDTALNEANVPDVDRVERIAREATKALADRFAEALKVAVHP